MTHGMMALIFSTKSITIDRESLEVYRTETDAGRQPALINCILDTRLGDVLRVITHLKL